MFDMSRLVQILSGSKASENCRPTKTVACRNVNCHHFILVTGLWWNVIRFPSSQSVHQSETNGWTEAVVWRFSTDPVITLNAAKTAHGVVGLRRRKGEHDSVSCCLFKSCVRASFKLSIFPSLSACFYKPELPLSGCESHKEAGECKCNQDYGGVMGSAENFTAC